MDNNKKRSSFNPRLPSLDFDRSFISNTTYSPPPLPNNSSNNNNSRRTSQHSTPIMLQTTLSQSHHNYAPPSPTSFHAQSTGGNNSNSVPHSPTSHHHNPMGRHSFHMAENPSRVSVSEKAPLNKQASTPSQPISSSLAASGPRRTSNAPRPRSLVGPADTHPSKKSQLSRRYRIAILISVIAVLLIGLIVGLSIFFTKKASTGGSSRPYNGVGNGTYVGNFSTPNAIPISQLPRPRYYAVLNTTFVPGRNIGEYRLARGDGGSSGAVAIHLALMRDSSKVLMMDRWDVYKTEATLPNGNPAWAVEYDYTTDTYRPLTLVSNLFCGGGMLLPDQRVMVIGGSENFTDLGGIEDGMKSIRLFAPSGSPGNFGDAPLVDDPSNTKLQLKSKRWYPQVVMLPEGRTLVIGGSIVGVAFTAPANNTGHMEILPPVSTSPNPADHLIPLQFLWDTLPANLYPTAALLPSGRIFISAADRATVLDPSQNYQAVKTVLVRTDAGTCFGFPAVAPTTPITTTTTTTTASAASGIPSSTTLPTALPTAAPSDGTRLPLSPCLPSTAFNQNRTSVSPQTFSFFATRLPQYYMTEPGDGVLMQTESRMCLSVEDTGVVLRACNDKDARQVLRMGSGRIVHVGSGRCLGTGDGGVTVGDCTSTSTSITLIDTSVYFEYPILPGGPFRNYPLTGFSLLLPLDPYDNYDPTVLICGGSQPINPSIPFVESEFNNALTSCGLIRPDQPNAQWEMDTMPTPRMLADLVHLPDGTILLLNGAKKGMAGWDLGRDPNFSAHLYIPNRPLGQRWHVLNNSTVPRLYHSVAQLLPDGRVMVAGSAPNSPTQLDYPKQFNNEYRVEYYHPHYLSSPFRPDILTYPEGPWQYNVTYSIRVNVPITTPSTLRFNLVQPGFRTHSTAFSQRLVWLLGEGSGSGEVEVVVGSPTDTVAPPGWYMLFAVLNGVPSVGKWVQVGGDPAGFATYYDM